MGTKKNWKFERDEATGREVRFFRDSEEPGYVFLAFKGFEFGLKGIVNLRTEYPRSVRMSIAPEKARELGLREESYEFAEQSATEIILKIPDGEWAERIFFD